MPSRIQALGALVLAIGITLQAYLRYYPYIRPGCQWSDVGGERILAFGDPQIIGFLQYHKWRKRLDILGNDRFLAQLSESMRFATKPDYTVILGDLLSSQWIPDWEFENRIDRYEHIFREDHPGTIINITGNHDIGYHGEITDERVSRYERRFGKLNYVVRESPEWRMVVLNSLTLDGPPFHDKWQNDTFAFLEQLRGYQGSTVLLTHIPLYKPLGICRDGPRFDFYPEDQADSPGHGLKQQNHLSQNATKLVLDSVFGDKGGVILTGHDHEGCESSYWRGPNNVWESVVGLNNGEVQEATVRSVMGEFGGNSGLLQGHFNTTSKTMQWNFSLCRFHVQHVWWIAQVVTIIGVGSLPALFAL